MSNLSMKERMSMDTSHFGDPAGRKFPIMDQSDLDAAAHLIGRAKNINKAKVKARIIAIARRKGLKLPEAWESPGDEPDNDADD